MKSAKARAPKILVEMSDREYLMRRAIAGTMPRLNKVFEEFGIHQEEHEVPMKVTKFLEGKARKATAKNVTAVAEAKKRKGAKTSKVTTKRWKMKAASAAASADASAVASAHVGEEDAEDLGGGSASAAAESGGTRSTSSLDLGEEDLVDTTFQGSTKVLCSSCCVQDLV